MVTSMGQDGLSLASVSWPDEDGALTKSVATFTRELFARSAIAFMSAEGDGPLALHSALATILDDIAHAPEMAYASVIELPRLGPSAHERHARMIDLFGELLATGFREMEEPPPNVDTMALCLAGSVWETIRRHAAEHRLHELPDALPAISHVCISTLYGLQESRRVNAPARGVDASPSTIQLPPPLR
jgi:hypothetical protein